MTYVTMWLVKKLMIGQWGENENLFEYIKQKLTDSSWVINIINLQCIYVVFGLIYFMTLVADIQVLSQSLLTDKHLPCLLPYIYM